VLRVKIRVYRAFFRLGLAALFGSAALSPADRGIVPLSVCDLVRQLRSYDGQTVAVVGRYSYRAGGRWVAEQSCPESPGTTPALWVMENPGEAPKAPDVFEFVASDLDKKLAEVQAHTTLAKFRFGVSDFDRWALLYGKVVVRNGDDAKQYAANLIIRSQAMIIFLPRP
jgi:hypothetical protein